MTLKELKQNFDILDNDEIYSYLLDLSQALPQFPDKYKREENKVKGCASTVYFKLESKDSKINPYFFADSKILGGVLYIFYLALLEKKSDLKKIVKDFKLNEILSSQRQNGIISLINQLKEN